jgi:hypothetical protein
MEGIVEITLKSRFRLSQAVYTVCGGEAHCLAASSPCTWQGDKDDTQVVLFPAGAPLWEVTYSQSGVMAKAITPEAEAMSTPLEGVWAVCGCGQRPLGLRPHRATARDLVICAADHQDYSRLLTEAEADVLIRRLRADEAAAEAAAHEEAAAAADAAEAADAAMETMMVLKDGGKSPVGRSICRAASVGSGVEPTGEKVADGDWLLVGEESAGRGCSATVQFWALRSPEAEVAAGEYRREVASRRREAAAAEAAAAAEDKRWMAAAAAVRRSYSGTRLFGAFRRAGIPPEYWA